jgi:outer membrane protein OmpA-like peptidoglycan-associated protein
MAARTCTLILCWAVAVVASACATKGFVREQIAATETRLDQRADVQETQIRETADVARTARHGVDATEQELKGLDTQMKGLDVRVGQVGTLASAAAARADSATVVAEGAETRLSQRIAGRNRFRVLETKSIYFDVGRADIRNDDLAALDDIAKAVAADPNAVLELQGFTDPRGSDRYNDALSRARVDAVVRHLVQRQGIELRQLHAASMGKAALATGEKPGDEAYANARRVDIRLLAPWSSWEDRQAQTDVSSDDAVAASPATTESRPATPASSPRGWLQIDDADTSTVSPALREILRTISKEDLGVGE